VIVVGAPGEPTGSWSSQRERSKLPPGGRLGLRGPPLLPPSVPPLLLPLLPEDEPASLPPEELAPDELAPDELAPDELPLEELAPEELPPEELEPEELAPDEPPLDDEPLEEPLLDESMLDPSPPPQATLRESKPMATQEGRTRVREIPLRTDVIVVFLGVRRATRRDWLENRAASVPRARPPSALWDRGDHAGFAPTERPAAVQSHRKVETPE
jgi:hypothetical protein